MSSRWERPKPRVYEYNYKIQSDYYRPTLANLDTGKKEPQAKTFAERIKKYPLYGGEYPDRPEEEEEEFQGRQFCRRESQPVLKDGRPVMFYRPSSTRGLRSSSVPPGYERQTRDTSVALQEARAKLQELEERQFPQRQRLWQKHPYYVPEESIVVPPHESSIWPESRPHFHLVSSYDLMVGYLGIKGMGERDADRQRRREAQQ